MNGTCAHECKWIGLCLKTFFSSYLSEAPVSPCMHVCVYVCVLGVG